MTINSVRTKKVSWASEVESENPFAYTFSKSQESGLKEAVDLLIDGEKAYFSAVKAESSSTTNSLDHKNRAKAIDLCKKSIDILNNLPSQKEASKPLDREVSYNAHAFLAFAYSRLLSQKASEQMDILKSMGEENIFERMPFLMRNSPKFLSQAKDALSSERR